MLWDDPTKGKAPFIAGRASAAGSLPGAWRCGSGGTISSPSNTCLSTGPKESFLKQRVKCGINVQFVPLSKLSCLSIWPLFNVSHMKHASRGCAVSDMVAASETALQQILAQSSNSASLWWYRYLLLKTSSAVITWHQRPWRIRTNKEKCSGGFRRGEEPGWACLALRGWNPTCVRGFEADVLLQLRCPSKNKKRLTTFLDHEAVQVINCCLCIWENRSKG